MTLHRMSPRVADVSAIAPRKPRWIAGLVIAAAAMPAIIALVDDRIGFRIVMATFAVTLVLLGALLLMLLGAVTHRAVTIDADAGSLRFSPPATATAATSLIGVSLLLPAIAQLVVDVTGLPTMTGIFISRGPYLLGAVGVVVLVVQAWRLRVPAGLELTPDGLRGIRAVTAVEWTWQDLAAVDVVAAPAAKLSLTPRGGAGRPVLAPALALGSDPHLVAPIVRYYLEHPAERSVLAEGGVAAVRHVEEGLAERAV